MTLDFSRWLHALLAVFLIGISVMTVVVSTSPVSASSLTFASMMNLSNNPVSCIATCSSLPHVATSGSNVYVAWLNNTAGNSNLLFRSSNNNGSSFAPIIKISNSTTENADQQQMMAVGSDVYIVWQQNVSLSSNNILFRASTNNGISFGPVTNLSSGVSCGSGCSLTTSTVPEVAAVGNNVYVAWLAVTSKGTYVIFRASNNNGSSFAAALILSKTAYGSAQPQVAALASNVYVTWSDLGTVGRSQTFFALSSNGGTSFGTAFSLGSTLAGETDLYQEIAAAGTNVYVTWTNDTMFTDNTMFAGSTNNGASFGGAINLNKGSVTDLYPELAASGSSVYVVWSDAPGTGNTEVLYRTSSNNGASFGSILNVSQVSGTSNQQTITATGNNVYITWIDSSTSNNGLYFISSSDNGSTFGSPLNLSNDSVSNNPIVAGSGSYAYVAWEDDATGNGDIYFTSTVFDFSLSNSGQINIIQGSSGSNKITLTLQGGSSQSVNLACTGGLPAGASCSFNPPSAFPSSSSNLTISTQLSTPTGSYNVTVTGSTGSLTHSTQVTLIVSSSGAVGGTLLGVDKLALAAPYLAFALLISSIVVIPRIYHGRKYRS